MPAFGAQRVSKDENMQEKNGMMIKAIENGTVLDHIPPKMLANIISVLKLNDLAVPWTVGNNFQSKKALGGTKAFIKVTDYYFKKEDLYLVSLFAPNATVNIIESSTVVKHKIEIPSQVEKLLKCMNPTCITNKPGEPFETSLAVSKTESGLPQLICKYCQKISTQVHLR